MSKNTPGITIIAGDFVPIAKAQASEEKYKPVLLLSFNAYKNIVIPESIVPAINTSVSRLVTSAITEAKEERIKTDQSFLL